ncbi:hypothetical protein AB0L53_05735 [Nonomuraea sp. NPDC052129]|uniref:uridine kinase family protein n=1 Tax=Nonomuraea sp. NPDC052129 TaxID=3154651 RepID=UPI00342A798A
MAHPLVVGIAGGSASGKTTITTGLRTALEQSGRTVDVLASDLYMHHDVDRGPVFVSPTTGETTFDCNRPESIDWLAFLRDLDTRTSDVEAPDVLLVEGLMILHIAAVRERLHLRLFVELDADERALRRLLRDMKKPRGPREPEVIANYYRESARIGHALYVEPSRQYADIIVRGDALLDRVQPLLLAMIDRLLGEHGAREPSTQQPSHLHH